MLSFGSSGACEGSVACSTCHVILPLEYYDLLPEPDDDENDMLDMAFGLTDTSRLGCQVKLTKELDGITATLPAATRNMFVDGTWPAIIKDRSYRWPLTSAYRREEADQALTYCVMFLCAFPKWTFGASLSPSSKDSQKQINTLGRGLSVWLGFDDPQWGRIVKFYFRIMCSAQIWKSHNFLGMSYTHTPNLRSESALGKQMFPVVAIYLWTFKYATVSSLLISNCLVRHRTIIIVTAVILCN